MKLNIKYTCSASKISEVKKVFEGALESRMSDFIKYFAGRNLKNQEVYDCRFTYDIDGGEIVNEALTPIYKIGLMYDLNVNMNFKIEGEK